MIRAGVVGATGYTGVELLRLLLSHPQAQPVVVTSRGNAGEPLAAMFPNLRGHTDLTFTEPDAGRLADCDVVFFATPHGVAHGLAGELLSRGTRVIDLSADFRLRDPELWARWYGQPHGAPELLDAAVYGLPEINRASIPKARLIAVPGCYPTAVILGFIPLLEQGLVDTGRLVADAKSGVSGAGRKAQVGTLLCEASETFKAYGVPGHRHLPEILQTLAQVAGAQPGLTFVPHLLPMIRGIHATLYATLSDPGTDVQALYETRYRDEPFVDVMPAGSHPETRSVRGTNRCRLAVHRPQDGDTVVVLSVIDNLVKGASGQAIQNLNLMFGLAETTGLDGIAVLP
ncbi:N-acetyl-gamma-glutamyl-phosphate reductase [Thioalkalivibrio denitrificans]|uniref:N-acetyl-gamma-glutamyl-phosphate reductase n=1 Tax=Thioalkalivibrio denitrificans TaxID=108003 RepID=A0A1V3NUT4_9GAMM|nr:N-acetyl-gamma-glutamyl-phosphate reductase [Thioalkalivibrio denitrificans]OOG28877.1 N-acetyl-gamma-glutamyl-phosphate reductase [Thioalkalivibrio denitrificans]